MKQRADTGRWVVIGVTLLTIVGLALRLSRYGQTVIGDELSTLYIVRDRSLLDAMDLVSGDAEISPPLYFILAWLSTKLGSAAEVVRVPSLVAGTISIPLVYLLGCRVISRPAGFISAAVMAVSPFMILYSTDGRGYAVAIALLLGSTLAMLAGVRTGRTRWWVGYGALSLLAMYTHYTSAFVLIAQLGWLMWAHPEARKPALIANAGAAVLYLPWVPGLLADMRSPTIEILDVLQGSGFETKLQAFTVWIVGRPYAELSDTPGAIGVAAFFSAFAVAVGYSIWQRAKASGSIRSLTVSRGLVLVLALALATPIFELVILLLGGTDLFGARNLNVSSAGISLLVGAVLSYCGGIVGVVCTAAILAVLGFGALATVDDDRQLINLKRAAASVEELGRPGDVVVDMASAAASPVPLTALNAHLESDLSEYRPFLPAGDPPYLPLRSTPEPTSEILGKAFAEARGYRILLLGFDDRLVTEDGKLTGFVTDLVPQPGVPPNVYQLPNGSKVLDSERFPGLIPLNLFVIEAPGSAGQQTP